MSIDTSNHGFTGEKGIYKLDKILQDISDLKSNTSSTTAILNAIYPIGAVYLGIRTDDNPEVWGKKNGLSMNWAWTPFGGESKFLLLASPKDPNHIAAGNGYAGGLTKTETGTQIRYSKNFALSANNMPAHTHKITKQKAYPQLEVNSNIIDSSEVGVRSQKIYRNIAVGKQSGGQAAYLIWRPVVNATTTLSDGRLHYRSSLPEDTKVADPYQVDLTIPDMTTTSAGEGTAINLDVTPPYYSVYMWRRTK